MTTNDKLLLDGLKTLPLDSEAVSLDDLWKLKFDPNGGQSAIHILEILFEEYCDDLNPKQPLPSNTLRNVVERTILFLQTEQSYQWPVQKRSPKLILALVSMLIVSLSLFLLGTPHFLVASILLLAAAGFVYSRKIELTRSHTWQNAGDCNYWPFLNRTDFERTHSILLRDVQ